MHHGSHFANNQKGKLRVFPQVYTKHDTGSGFCSRSAGISKALGKSLGTRGSDSKTCHWHKILLSSNFGI